jgi:hypothetical protein
MNDDQLTVAGQVHVALEAVDTETGGVVERGNGVLRPQLRAAAVRDHDDAGR